MALSAFIAATAIASEPAAAADPSPKWASCADEGQLCSFTGTKQVRYGDYDISGETWMLGKWTVKTVAGPAACTNAVFGDPFANRRKHCEVDVSPWTFCANEGEICRVQGTKQIRYGADGFGNGYGNIWSPKLALDDEYIVRTFTGYSYNSGFSCTNSAFGEDPTPDVVKACWIYNY